MIEYALLTIFGFLLASFLALLLAIPFWRRAVRLTRQRMAATLPMSLAEIQAEKDQIRAEYAIKIRRREIAREKDREKAARYLVERNRNQMTINALKVELRALSRQLAERSNESTVLEQTVQKRIPELEGRMERARKIVATRDRELARLQIAYDNQTEALGLAKKAAQRYRQELDTLREAMETGILIGRRGKNRDVGEISLMQDNQRYQAQLSRLRQQIAEMKEIEVADNALLRSELQRLARQMMQAAPAKPAKAESASGLPLPPALAKTDGAAHEKRAETSTAKKEKALAAPTPARADAGGGQQRPRTSLAERLKRLRPRAQA